MRISNQTFHFGQPARRLFGVLELPSRNIRAGLVLCPPFGDEMVSTYAALARWSKQLAQRGIAVLRFHPFGTGESDGTFADFTLQGALSDLSEAVSYLCIHTGLARVGLFGVRFGGFLAAQFAQATSLDFLLLWSPITSSRQYFRSLLRMRLTAELIYLQTREVKTTTERMVEEFQAGRSVDILGNEFSAELFHQMTAALSWPERVSTPRVLWLSRPADGPQPASLAQKWVSPGCKAECQCLPEAPFWEELSRIFPERFAKASEAWLI